MPKKNFATYEEDICHNDSIIPWFRNICTRYSKSNIDTIVVAPIVSPHLQGARKATEEEKEYARQLAEERNQHQTPQNLQSFDEYSGTINNNDVYYPYWNYGEGFDLWRLHKGLNVNLSASVLQT